MSPTEAAAEPSVHVANHVAKPSGTRRWWATATHIFPHKDGAERRVATRDDGPLTALNQRVRGSSP